MSTENQSFDLDSLLGAIMSSPETDLTKTASAAAPDVAAELQSLLTKQASESIGENIEMSNQATATGNQIAAGILNLLTKQAETNMVQADLDKMEGQHDDRIELNPVQGKTISEMAKALMDRAATNGGAAAPERTAQEVAAEGRAQDPELAAGPSDLSKQASEAIGMLINEGVSFDDAVELVKQAADQLATDSLEFEKAAAVDQLVAEGYDFLDAAELVKQAAAELYGSEDGYSELEKAAAVHQLIAEEGLDLDEAVELVKEAAAVKWVAKTGKDKAVQAAKYAAAAVGGAAAGAGAAAIARKK